MLGLVVSHVQADDLALVGNIARETLPLVAHWWYPRTSATQSESLNSVRDEILRMLFGLQLHIEALAHEPAELGFLTHIEDVLDALWTEYSKREDRTRLQMADLTFSFIPTNYFDNKVYGLSPYNTAAERRWAVVEVIAVLESIHVRASMPPGSQPLAEEEQPRKRRRVEEQSSRLRERLKSSDLGTKLTALQIAPFFLQKYQITLADVLGRPGRISWSHQQQICRHFILVDDCQCQVGRSYPRPLTLSNPPPPLTKDRTCSYALLHHSRDPSLSDLWKQIAQVAIRSVSVSGTSRAACLILHSILEAHLVSYHAIADDINAMVTAADISGPALLVDSSLVLMLHLLHLRNTMLPSASQATSSHIIRWLFSRWKLGS